MPDLIYASVEFVGPDLHELYAVRKRIRRILGFRHAFMEELADDLIKEFPDAAAVEIHLAFNRHVIRTVNVR